MVYKPTCYTQLFYFYYPQPLKHSCGDGKVVKKIVVVSYHHDHTVNQLKYSEQPDTQALNLVTGHGSLSLYELVSHSSSQSHLAYMDSTLTQFEGMVYHSITLVRTYSSALIYYIVPLEHADHTTTTAFVKIKIAKVDLTTSVQSLWPYQHIQKFTQLPLIQLGEPMEPTSIHQALKPL